MRWLVRRMDDVEDDSLLRRGMPGNHSPKLSTNLALKPKLPKLTSSSLAAVAHKIYGVPQTINSANYVYFLAYQSLAKIKAPDTSAIHKMVTGQCLSSCCAI